MTLRVAITGGSGVLGTALRDIRPRWDYLSRADCDVRDRSGVYAALVRWRPDVVLHAAALTDHQHPNAAEVIETNIVGTQHVVRACRALGLPLVYVSTHYVYEGTTGGYVEDCAPKPIGAYAWSKYAAENVVRSAMPRNSLVVRGSWYTRETRLRHWAQRGALVDAYCSREPVAVSARKIAALIEAEVLGVVNIGGLRRSFAQILCDEGYDDFPVYERADFDAKGVAPYAFPADTSVSTAKFDALGLAWR
jgi:dTDP-4-dehydrorhamnose reductase